MRRKYKAAAIHELDKASAAKETYVGDRQQGARKTGRRIMEGVSSLANFVEKFSRVIEGCSHGGTPYAMVAYETLSVLLRVGLYMAYIVSMGVPLTCRQLCAKKVKMTAQFST